MSHAKIALIVDDEPSIRYFFRSALELNGFDCQEAEDGESALDSLHTNRYDLMLLDVRMPGIGGLDVLREVRKWDTALPIIVVTALGDPEIAARALTESGANAFLGKPCTVDEIQSVAGRLCQSAVV